MTRAPPSARRAAALSPASPAPITSASYDRAAPPGELTPAGAPPRARPGSSRREVLHVEHALEDPVVQPRLAQLVAVEDRPDALPALLQEVAQRVVGLDRVELLDAVQDAGRAVDAKAALARPHAKTQRAADVVEVR